LVPKNTKKLGLQIPTTSQNHSASNKTDISEGIEVFSRHITTKNATAKVYIRHPGTDINCYGQAKKNEIQHEHRRNKKTHFRLCE
jgi:hypothetical protein